MRSAPRLELTAPKDARVRYLVQAYADIIRSPAALERAIERLPIYPGRKRIGEWKEMADAGNFEALADAMVERHYDPSYESSRRTDQRPVIGTFALSTLDAADLDGAAASVARMLSEKLDAA
jgi:tRNA 2-selenouridine synthase